MLKGNVSTLVQEWVKTSQRHDPDNRSAKIEEDPLAEIMTLIWRMQFVAGGGIPEKLYSFIYRHLGYNLAAVT